MILDNRHSTIGVAQQWDQLNQLAMRIRNNLEQQIYAKNGVAEDALKEFSMMFRHFNMASWISMQSSLASLPLELYRYLSKERADYRTSFREHKKWAGHNRYKCLIHLFHSFYDFLII